MKRLLKFKDLEPGMLVQLVGPPPRNYPMLVVETERAGKKRRGHKPFWGPGTWAVTFFDTSDMGYMGPCSMAPGNDAKFKLVAARGTKEHKKVCDAMLDRQCDVIASARTNCNLLREYRDRK